MPPKEKLTDTVVRDFRHWIEQGAPVPRVGSSRSTSSSAATASVEPASWWSLQPLSKPPVPALALQRHPGLVHRSTRSSWPDSGRKG